MAIAHQSPLDRQCHHSRHLFDVISGFIFYLVNSSERQTTIRSYAVP